MPSLWPSYLFIFAYSLSKTFTVNGFIIFTYYSFSFLTGFSLNYSSSLNAFEFFVAEPVLWPPSVGVGSSSSMFFDVCFFCLGGSSIGWDLEGVGFTFSNFVVYLISLMVLDCDVGVDCYSAPFGYAFVILIYKEAAFSLGFT